ncbi:DNA replication licensing factor MCM8 [Trichuris trichiura]|uniref:DNA replication licensing factor MCM8 n=1 Tax=Trichuris trichiura TaxID=36087 RepID=A0A077ZCX8_TRITR|nr:DNA replication licensing factor MCM8 [Trichuris trichiura]
MAFRGIPHFKSRNSGTCFSYRSRSARGANRWSGNRFSGRKRPYFHRRASTSLSDETQSLNESSNNFSELDDSNAVSSPVLYVISDEEPPNAKPPRFAGWPIYFPCVKCEDKPETCALVEWCVEYLSNDADSPLNNFDSILAGRHFLVDVQHFFKHLTEERCLKVQQALRSNADDVISAMGLAMYELVIHRLDVGSIKLPKINARFWNFGPTVKIRDIQFSDCNRLVSFVGVVVRIGSCRPKCTRVAFLCESCNRRFSILLTDDVYITPSRCISKDCGGTLFEPLLETNDPTETVDWQQLRVQELVTEQDRSHSQENLALKTIDCELVDDLVGCCSSGSVVCITGVVKMKKNEEARKRYRWQYAMFISVTSVAVKKGLFSVAHSLSSSISRENELTIVEELMSNQNLFAQLVASFCPTIYGEHMVKAALVLSLFGASSKEFSLNRNTIHVLIIGDPGLGESGTIFNLFFCAFRKTHLLQACVDLSPIGVYVSGNTTTVSGLTVTIGHDSCGDSTIDAGALVISNDGCCCIDEFDKMTNQHKVLLEVMEQQQVSVFKAGTHSQFPAKVSVIAAINPAQGNYDRQMTVADNVKINSALLSRFDVIFLLLDEADEERDRRISAHVIQLRRPHSAAYLPFPEQPIDMDSLTSSALSSLKHRIQTEVEKGCLIPGPIFRKYIAFCRHSVNPHLSSAACNVLADFFQELNQEYTVQGIPSGTRQMESLIRLTQARARCELRDEATERDALDVIEILRSSMCQATNFAQHPFQQQSTKKQPKRGQQKIYRFIEALKREMVSKSDSSLEFPAAQLKQLAMELRLELSQPFECFLSKLNENGTLILKGHQRYALNPSLL